MGLLALLPGTVAGVVIAYLINVATLPVTGHPVQFMFHPLLLAGGLLIGLMIVVLAAWPPAGACCEAGTDELSSDPVGNVMKVGIVGSGFVGRQRPMRW